MSIPAANSRFEIALNTDGLLWINKTGMTKFCTRISCDIDGSWDETGYEDMEVYSSEFRDIAIQFAPYIDIFWTGMDWVESAKWLFDFATKIWVDTAAWTYNLVTMAWENISWIFYLGTSIWTDIAIWGASLVAMMWSDVATYTINLFSMAWHDLGWLFSLLPPFPAWNDIARWLFSLPTSTGSGLLLIAIVIGVILGLGFLRLTFGVRKRKRTQTSAEMLYRVSYRIRKEGSFQGCPCL
jgi:hypothetical protein